MKKKVAVTVILLIATAPLSGCAAALVGGAIYHSSKTNEQRAEFTQNFERTNLQREQSGLQPMDWCSEVFKFDASWAKSKPECKERVKRYEAGDTTALKP